MTYNPMPMSSETKPAEVKKTPSKRRAGPGRPKGVPNKISGTAKENFVCVFNRLGGTAEMARWANENQTEFYKLYAKLLPLQVGNAEDSPFEVIVRVSPHVESDR